MEIFRHIRESHLTEIKKLNIKIGLPPETDKKTFFRKPGPRSKTRPGLSPAKFEQETSESQPADNNVEAMDFESAINSLEQLSKSEQEQQMILSNNESQVTFETKF